jgi:hypothetical protein
VAGAFGVAGVADAEGRMCQMAKQRWRGSLEDESRGDTGWY